VAKKPEDENKGADKPKVEKSKTDVWRGLERDAQIAEAAATEARRCADQIGSDIAKELIESHKGNAIELDGQMYTPKARATRTLTDGTVKVPRLPFQLVRYAPKSTVEI
jgi:hypothetical protein